MTFLHRHFNNVTLSSDNKYIIKSSKYKLDNEIQYYMNIPDQVKYMFPKLAEHTHDMNCYKMEYINGNTFSELFVSKQLQPGLFQRMLKQLMIIHEIKPCDNHVDIYANYEKKLTSRYNLHHDAYQDLENSQYLFTCLVRLLKSYANSDQGKLGMIHGDPVFTNIILSTDAQDIKFIDMRGKVGDVNTIYGDIAYDWAKIYQSLIGYDAIISGTVLSDDYIQPFVDIFWKFCPFHTNTIKVIASSLLFSLIPLHNEHQSEFIELCASILKTC